MTKIGRNQPCPRGSGKKYKKCCWASDEQQRLAAMETICPHCGYVHADEEVDDWDDDFESPPFPDVFAQAQPDPEELYDSFLDFHDDLARGGDLAACLDWIERIRQRHPAAFAAEAPWYCRD